MKRTCLLTLSLLLLAGVAAYAVENTTWGMVKELFDEETAAPAAKGAAEITPVDAYVFDFLEPNGPPCGANNLIFEVEGNTMHILMENYALTSSLDPRVNGQARVDVDVWINQVSGAGRYHGTLTIDAAAYDGGWKGDFKGHFPGGQPIDFNGMTIVVGAEMVLRGTGVFEGLTFKFNHLLFPGYPGAFALPAGVEDPDGEGRCDFFGEVWSGRILDPNAQGD